MTLPCVIGQLIQIFFDSVVVKFMAKMVDEEEKEKVFEAVSSEESVDEAAGTSIAVEQKQESTADPMNLETVSQQNSEFGGPESSKV